MGTFICSLGMQVRVCRGRYCTCDRAELTVSIVDKDEETCRNVFLEADDCLLNTESLKEDWLCDIDMASLRGAWPRKCRQGTFSARVFLLKRSDYYRQRPRIGFMLTLLDSLSGALFHLYFE